MKKPNGFFDTKFEFKDAPSDSGIIKGHAAVFDNIDLGMDVIERGAFKKTIKESNGIWPILKDHDHHKKIGFNLSATEDEKGLLIEEQLDLNTKDGAEVFSLSRLAHKIGAKDGLSIGFFTIKKEPNKENPMVRHLKEVRMLEHSHVTFPMNPEAFTNAAKSWMQNHNLGLDDYCDDFYLHMENIGYSFKEINNALEKVATKKIDPKSDILQSIEKAINILK